MVRLKVTQDFITIDDKIVSIPKMVRLKVPGDIWKMQTSKSFNSKNGAIKSLP